VIEASIPTDKINKRRWDLISVAMRYLQKENKGKLLDMRFLKVIEEKEKLIFSYCEDTLDDDIQGLEVSCVVKEIDENGNCVEWKASAKNDEVLEKWLTLK